MQSPCSRSAVGRLVCSVLFAGLLALSSLALPSPAWAEEGWVRGDLRLNLRSGAGLEYRILGSVATGDQVKVLNKGTDWTRIETQDAKVGWIPAGYVEMAPPPSARLAAVETEATTLRSELEKLRNETKTMREENARLSTNDEGQEKELETLKLENLELRAVSRYQEWLTGGALLGGGMLAGAWLHSRNANRRPSSRIRL